MGRALAVALLSLLFGCSLFFAAEEKPPPFLPGPERAENVLGAALGDSATAMAVLPTVSSVEVVHPPTPCHTWQPWYQGNAISINAHAGCVAGREFVAIFRRGFTNIPGGPRPAWLLVSTAAEHHPVNLNSLGFDSCWMMLSQAPAHLHSLIPTEGSILQNDRHALVLRWTPGFNMVGRTLSAQMVWLEPAANNGHALWSPMLRIRVGTEAPRPFNWVAWWASR